MNIKLRTSSSKLAVILATFYGNLNLVNRFSKSHQYQISWKSIQWEPSYFMRWNEQTDMKLIVVFQNFPKAP